MKLARLFIILLLLMISVGAVSASDSNATSHLIRESGHTFTDLENDINASGDFFNVEHDYTFSNESDKTNRVIERSNFTINGNNHVLDGNGQSRILSLIGENITINNLIFKNGNFENIGALRIVGSATLNNVSFINNTGYMSGAVYVQGGQLNCNGCRFIDNYADTGGALFAYQASMNVADSNFTSSKEYNFSAVYGDLCDLHIDNCLFYNFTSRYACAIYVMFSNLAVNNSRFINLKALMSAGAIFAKNFEYLSVENSTFANLSSKQNGGAILFDCFDSKGWTFLTGCDFTNCSSDFGGAILQLDGFMSMTGCSFKNNTARCLGGAIYNSYVDLNVTDSTFEANGAENFSAIYFDFGILSILKSNFTANGPDVWAVYLCDATASIINSTFENGRFNIYGDFMRSCLLEGNVLDTSTISIGNENYVFCVQNSALPLNMTVNVINVSDYPIRFDLRDWGWVSPVKNQGIMGACWSFATIECIETALLRATGIQYNLSENNLKDFAIKYSPFGYLVFNEAGNSFFSMGYALSWIGPVFEADDEYDEMGKTSWYVQEGDRIRIQDTIIIIPYNMSYVRDVKRTIINHGAVSITYNSGDEYFNEESSAHYCNETVAPDHSVAIIGWDDNYSADNFLITPPGDGAWIVKNSWGSDWGEEGYFYLSYYEASFFYPDDDTGEPWPFVAFVFENPISYHVNYQTDLSGIFYFDDNYTQYSNEYEAISDDLIGAVGTYFKNEGVEYSFDIYVNGRLIHSQSGISDFPGYRTIVLDRYVSLRAGDRFKIVFRSSSLPYQSSTRQHVKANVSMASSNGSQWKDLAELKKTACLKAYTVADDSTVSGNGNIAVDYTGGKYFSVKVTTADGVIVTGASVKFTIDKRTATVTTDKNGIAKLKITEAPGKYKITTTCNGKSVKNTVGVRHVVSTSKFTVKKTAKSFALKAVLKINGKAVKGKWITFKFKGKNYRAKTNARGIAQKTFDSKVVKTLKKGATYRIKATYLKDTVRTTLKVK